MAERAFAQATPGARRRNGKEASCEPCRKMKMRCDHARPVCGRCQRRGTKEACYYHPAPLTRKHVCACSNTSTSSPASPRPQVPTSPSIPRVARALSVPEINHGSAQFEESQPGSHFPEQSLSAFVSETPASLPPADTIKSSSFDLRRDDSRAEGIASLARVLRHLLDLDRLHELVFAYYAQSQVAHIPVSLTLNALETMKESIQKFGLDTCTCESERSARLLHFAEAVYQSTTTRISITADLTPAQFMAMYSGNNLRIELVGFILCAATRYCLLSLYGTTNECDDYMYELYRSTSFCYNLARETTRMNDVLLWLSHDHMIMLTIMKGDSSEDTWRCLGDLYSDVLSMGLHSEKCITADTPFFLTEIRRSSFSRIFYTDKFISPLFDRPPRMLKRHADTRRPLELTHEEILGDPAELSRVLEKLNPDGWRIETKYCAATWARTRFVVAQMAEEIADYKWRALSDEDIVALKNLSIRNNEARRGLPERLQYSRDCWSTENSIHPQICFMICLVRVSFLQNDAQIWKLLQGHDPTATWELLKTAAETATLVQELGSFRRKSICLHQRFAGVLLCHGLPAIIILAKAAERVARSRGPALELPPELSHSKLVRLLSVYVSLLDSIANRGEMHYEISARASKGLSETLDDLLDGPKNRSMDGESALLSPPSNPDASGGSFSDGISRPYDWDRLDLFNWSASLDWATAFDDWTE